MRNRILQDTKKRSLYDTGNVLSLKGLRKCNMVCVMIWAVFYAWVIIFNTWWTAEAPSNVFFSLELRGLIHIIILISSIIFIFVIHKEMFIKTARIGVVLLLLDAVLFLFAPTDLVKLLSAIIIGISIGCVMTSILIPFIFTLNNTEKLYAIVGSNILISIISFTRETEFGHTFKNTIDVLIFIIMIIISVTLFLKRGSISIASIEKDIDTPVFNKRLYLTLLFNSVFIALGKGACKGILNIAVTRTEYSILSWYYIAGLFGCLIFIVVFAFSSKPIVLAGNISFGSLAMGLLCNSLAERMPELYVIFAFMLGIGSTVGMINLYYIIGVVGKKYNSMRYLKLSVFFIGVCGGISGIILGNVIQNIKAYELSIVISIFVMAVLLIFMMLSPMVSQSNYYDDWAKDSEMIEIDNEHLYMFKKYQLSKREMQVCKLLLQGYTMRQISGIMSIAYSTVNTYCTSAYRKMGINSRTELLILFKDYKMK